MRDGAKTSNNPRAHKDAFSKRYQDPARALVVLMERFAARVCHAIDGAVVKGGLGLELRLDTPRTTKDVDLIISGSHDLDSRLASAGMLGLGDFLKFVVRPDKKTATFIVPGMKYHAKRYAVQAYFADRTPLPSQEPFRKFALEISIENVAAFDIFLSKWDFGQVEDAVIRVYSLHWQIAEKVHAYTDSRHRDTTNPGMMRPRDLLDLCRCAVATTPMARIESGLLREALEQTFQTRKAAAPTLHGMPPRLPEIPLSWTTAFDNQVKEASLPWHTPASAHATAARFLDPVLAGTATGTWDPNSGWG